MDQNNIKFLQDIGVLFQNEVLSKRKRIGPLLSYDILILDDKHRSKASNDMLSRIQLQSHAK